MTAATNTGYCVKSITSKDTNQIWGTQASTWTTSDSEHERMAAANVAGEGGDVQIL